MKPHLDIYLRILPWGGFPSLNSYDLFSPRAVRTLELIRLLSLWLRVLNQIYVFTHSAHHLHICVFRVGLCLHRPNIVPHSGFFHPCFLLMARIK